MLSFDYKSHGYLGRSFNISDAKIKLTENREGAII